MNPLPEIYQRLIGSSIDANGVYPHHCLWRKNGKVSMAALALPRPRQVLATVVLTMIQELPDELIYGLDRFCLPGQGTTLRDCIAGAHYCGDKWRPFVIEYQHEPRIVKPIAWDNEFWNCSVGHDIEVLSWQRRTLRCRIPPATFAHEKSQRLSWLSVRCDPAAIKASQVGQGFAKAKWIGLETSRPP